MSGIITVRPRDTWRCGAPREAILKVTFFVSSIIGFVDNPAAIYTRGLAHGLAVRGNDVRVVEQRQNAAMTRTLQVVGAVAARHVYESFPLIQYTTVEPRSGASLLEWVTRELALIDVAVAVQGLDDELCRWIANVTRPNLTRAYLAWQPELLTDERVTFLELLRYDDLLAREHPAADVSWKFVPACIAVQDQGEIMAPFLRGLRTGTLTDPLTAAAEFEALVTQRTP